MFYRLKPSYVLRGWKGMSWVLVRRPKNQIQILSKEVFQVLMLCDGETELQQDLLDDQMRDALEECKEKGYVEHFDEKKPLMPDQYYKYYHNRYVRKVFWSVTGRCNFRCRHCFMDAPDAALGELSTEEALDLINQMAECGVLQVDITGGEPLIRKDIWQLIDCICSHQITIGSFHTNGWLLNEYILNEFEKRGIKPEIMISFDGVGWHDWMRGVNGAEESALYALKLCHDRGFTTSVGMCIHRGNLDTFSETVNILSKIGVTCIKTAHIQDTDLWIRYNDGNAMTQQEYIEAMLPYILWYYENGKPIKELDLSGVATLSYNKPGEMRTIYYDNTEKCQEHYLCGAVRWSCYITPEGRLLPCMPMTACEEQKCFPRIQDIGLKQGLDDSYYMRFINSKIKDLFEVNGECAACEYRYKCGGGCRAVALLKEHDLMGCDREKCLFWKKGYAERIQRALTEAENKYM